MSRPLMFALTVAFGLWHIAECRGAEAAALGTPNSPPQPTHFAAAGPALISVRKNASELESFAANELRRYVYLRTGKLLAVKPGASRGSRIVVQRRRCGWHAKGVKI
ncbi:MAG TPA: hypothetical protein VMU04_13760 [Candidatus Acidoferrum sp.]|nr:hypothetical protein [Candidatus Acidoferrum sp.]